MTNPNESHMEQTLRQYYAGCFMEKMLNPITIGQSIRQISSQLSYTAVKMADDLIAELNRTDSQEKNNKDHDKADDLKIEVGKNYLAENGAHVKIFHGKKDKSGLIYIFYGRAFFNDVKYWIMYSMDGKPENTTKYNFMHSGFNLIDELNKPIDAQEKSKENEKFNLSDLAHKAHEGKNDLTNAELFCDCEHGCDCYSLDNKRIKIFGFHRQFINLDSSKFENIFIDDRLSPVIPGDVINDTIDEVLAIIEKSWQESEEQANKTGNVFSMDMSWLRSRYRYFFVKIKELKQEKKE